MDHRLQFQLAVSTAASVFSGASFALWLLSIEAFKQPAFNKKSVILSQAVISGVIILGSIASTFIAIRQASFKNSKWLSSLDLYL